MSELQEAAGTFDAHVGLNDRIGAALSSWVGTMWTVYATLLTFAVWMTLATWGPLQKVDGPPFLFLTLLGNMVQLLLCFVIIVGQRVLSRRADQRELQTYLNAGTIFVKVARLQDHLVNQDKQLARGVSLLSSSPHPWIALRTVEEPEQAQLRKASINQRLAAWLTQRMGTMWAFYAAAAFQIGWIALVQLGPLRPIDCYPYTMLLTVSSFAQLVLMFVIMVGQDVLGHEADRRAEQTSLNAEAILYECGRIEEHLADQDRVIVSLSGYMWQHVTEQLARAIHRSFVAACLARGEAPGSRESLLPWEELPESLRDSNRDQAQQAGEKLAAIGCLTVPRFDASPTFEYRGDEVLFLARMEHDRWVRERQGRGLVYGPVRDAHHHPDLVPWEQLTPETQDKDVQFVLDLPRLLDDAGFQILRLRPGPTA